MVRVTTPVLTVTLGVERIINAEKWVLTWPLLRARKKMYLYSDGTTERRPGSASTTSPVREISDGWVAVRADIDSGPRISLIT